MCVEGCRYAHARGCVERGGQSSDTVPHLPALFKVSAPCVLVSWPQSFWGLDTRADPGSDVDSGAYAAGLSNY